jgi:hypothetical protein
MYATEQERKTKMKLDEYKALVLAQREASKAEALSVLSAKISNNTERKEN